MKGSFNQATNLALRDGQVVPVRPIRAADYAAHQRFVQRLSERSRYLRFFSPISELSEAQTRRFTEVDGQDRLALVALDPQRPSELIAVVRYDREPGTDRAEFAAVVEDGWQGRGLGSGLAQKLAEIARRNGIRWLYALVLPENGRSCRLLRGLALPLLQRSEAGLVRVEVDLSADGSGAGVDSSKSAWSAVR